MKIQFLLFYTCIFCSCSQNSDSEGFEINTQDSVYNKPIDVIDTQNNNFPVEKTFLLDTVSGKKFNEMDSKFSSEIARITKLPFGPKLKNVNELYIHSFDFYDKLIGGKNEGKGVKYTTTYQLPNIKNVKYIVVDSSDEYYNCYHNIPIDSLLLINKYKCRLPDIGILEMYYMSNDKSISQDFTRAFERYCSTLIYDNYGHLILFNKKTQEAKVITIFYSYYLDSYRTREFYIDENYKIYISNKMYTEGDNGVDKHGLSGYEISISEDGSVTIKNRPEF